jgi:tripartite-type tricarboxylate transporter receptor subunit TctC
MEFRRRRFLKLTGVVAAASVLPQFARALDYPARPVRLVVGYSPGGTTSIAARLMGQWLSEQLGQPFVIENRPGAANNLATEEVVHAPADGYTLLAVTPANAVSATFMRALNFDFSRDIAMVAGITRTPLVLEVHPAVPANTVSEFIAYAKVNPSKLSMASFGTGTLSHVTGEMFKLRAGVDLLHVPYAGSAPMLIDLLGGRVQAAFDALPASIAHIKTGELRPLAVTTAIRSEALPDIPTVGESMPGFEAAAWVAIGVPKNTPAEIVNVLNKEINAGLVNPKVSASISDLGGMTFPGSPEDFGRLIADETEKWGKVIRAANIKPE